MQNNFVYKGEVTLNVIKNGKTFYKKIYNKGTVNLFNYIISAIRGDFASIANSYPNKACFSSTEDSSGVLSSLSDAFGKTSGFDNAKDAPYAYYNFTLDGSDLANVVGSKAYILLCSNDSVTGSIKVMASVELEEDDVAKIAKSGVVVTLEWKLYVMNDGNKENG